jgi:ketosteroid isomerase-like protein
LENIKKEIEHLVNKETQSWDEKNVESLLELFHEDMVWPWPKNERSHDPMEWEIVLGKYSYKRWKKVWEELFNKNDLIKNERVIKKIEISFEKDAAFAVVDIDTIWKNKETGKEISWKGRVCKVYSKCKNGWKITMHTGVLDYNNI